MGLGDIGVAAGAHSVGNLAIDAVKQKLAEDKIKRASIGG
jgi:hypothetical protein